MSRQIAITKVENSTVIKTTDTTNADDVRHYVINKNVNVSVDVANDVVSIECIGIPHLQFKFAELTTVFGAADITELADAFAGNGIFNPNFTAP